MFLLFILRVIYEHEEPWRNYTDRGKPKNLGKNLLSATLSSTNPTLTDLGANLGLCSEKRVTNCLSHGMALKSLTKQHIKIKIITYLSLIKAHNRI
jgi:hypothetical protein